MQKAAAKFIWDSKCEEEKINWLCRKTWVEWKRKSKIKVQPGRIKVSYCEERPNSKLFLAPVFFYIFNLKETMRISTYGSWDPTPQAELRPRPSYWKPAQVFERSPQPELWELFFLGRSSGLLQRTGDAYFPSWCCHTLIAYVNTSALLPTHAFFIPYMVRLKAFQLFRACFPLL